MNKHLQLIVDFIAQSTHLSEAEKSDLLQAAKATEKELAIIAFKLERTEKVKHTTGILLQETIEELEQKRKAVEAQNRDLEMESALERVRSRSMGMQKSDELKDVINIVFQQLTHLKISLDHAGFVVDYTPLGDWHFWIADERHIPSKITHPYFDSVWAKQFNEAKEKGIDFFTTYLNFEEKNKFYQDLLKHIPGLTEQIKDFYFSCAGLGASTVLLGDIGLYIENLSGHPYSDEENNILMRFAKVFQQTYTRFLDLQKAEAQAREAQIELGLERVRARAMAMQKSDELADAAQLLYHEFGNLGINTFSCGYMFVDEAKQTQTAWVVLPDGSLLPNFIVFPLNGDQVLDSRYKDWKEKKPIHVFELQGEANKEHHRFLANYVPPFVVDDIFSKIPDRIIFNCANFSDGYLLILAAEHFSPEEKQTIIRFAKVFEMTYTRFNDLKQAEAQAREARIEAALERVRSVAMSMMKSDDLLTICQSVFAQLQILGFKNLRAAQIYIRNDAIEKFMNYDYAVVTGADKVEVNYNSHSNTRRIYDIISNAGDGLVYNVIEKEQLEEWKSYLYNTLGQPPEESLNAADGLHYYLYSFGIGAFGICTFKVISAEELAILKRFRNVFNLSYQRYTDIALAEAQAREARIETALERVRSRTLAMQNSDELIETAAVLFQQLIALGILPNRLYISIIKSEQGESECWITEEDGTKVSTAFTANLNDNITFQKMFEGWKRRQKSLVVDMQGEELQNYFRHLTSLGVPFKNGLLQKRRVQDIAYFNKGFIGIASPDEQPVETLLLLERFAAVFNLTFTRFNDLKIAEAHALQAGQNLIAITEAKQKAETALTILQTTQKQLIQSEKMASLGELTAGIAHEIQNPLNFVNNFSEVSTELLDEMNEEIAKGNLEDAKQIAEDLKQNLEKINHHGKRAGDIVKGMLQHSRNSSNATKEPTDINKLADEYLRLAYHGLKAKDKFFNATIKTYFDESIGNIHIIPQDIGRVILNLITNAFYVVNEKSKQGITGYKPTVSLSTKTENNKVLITVKDNGNGISQKILDKIFQPFFTTKPTGQGTGLGLSLSYDIVKAHRGEIKVETKEGEGSEFIIQLPIV